VIRKKVEMEITEISTEVLYLPNEHLKTNMIFDLSTMDYFNNNVITRFGYVFQNENNICVDVSRMKQSLKETLIEYPELTASVKVDERIKIIYNNKGVLFKICKANISYKDVTEMKEVEKDMFLASDSSYETDENYLCRIKVTLLNDDSFTLGVSVNHTLQDAHGCFWFMNAWSHRFKNLNNKDSGFGQYTNSDISERGLFTGKGVEPATSSPIYKVEDSVSHWFVSCASCKPEDFHVSKNKLKYWKEMFQEIREKDVDPSFISSNDVLTAILFKAITQSKKLNENEAVTLGLVVNVRERFGLAENYTGNAIMGIGIATTVEKIGKMNICKLASLIRKELIAFDKLKIQANLSYFETAKNWKDVKTSIDLKKDVFLVSWESFPIFKPTFGLGEPKHFIFPSALYGVPFVKPLPSKDFVSVNLNLTNDQMEWVYNDENVRYITQKS